MELAEIKPFTRFHLLLDAELGVLSLTSVRSFFQYCMLTCSSTQIYSLLGRKWILNRFGRHAALLCKASTTCSGVLCVCAASCPLPLSLKLFMLLLELQKTPEVVFAGRLSPTFTLTPLLFQVLGAKFEHELLVDHPFSNTAGSCGNFLSSCAIFIHINAVYYSNDFITSKKRIIILPDSQLVYQALLHFSFPTYTIQY